MDWTHWWEMDQWGLAGKLFKRILIFNQYLLMSYCKLVNHVSVQVRSILPSYEVKNWKNVDVATRDVVLQNIAVNLHW